MTTSRTTGSRRCPQYTVLCKAESHLELATVGTDPHHVHTQ